jgi:hypothetical protein
MGPKPTPTAADACSHLKNVPRMADWWVVLGLRKRYPKICCIWS